jgi:hypothetical protein
MRDRRPFTIRADVMSSGGCTVTYDKLPEKPIERAVIRFSFQGS